MLKRILFGYADARTESAESPHLLMAGFFEYAKVTAEVFQGRRFLVLGPKGSGKSAIAERLRLLGEADYSLFASNCFLSDFPYADFEEIKSGLEDRTAGLGVSWTWILLLKLAESVVSDESALDRGPQQLKQIIAFLRARGLLSSDDMRELVTRSSKYAIEVGLPATGKVSASTEREFAPRAINLAAMADELRNALLGFRSESRHFVVIDGLDDILSAKTAQYQVLDALVRTTARLNMDLLNAGVPAKIVLLCRTDLFERLPGPNKSKIRQDYGILLNWVDDSSTPEESQLVRLANLRARLATSGSVTDVFRTYFPTELAGAPIVPYLLAYTRHTPRDFLQLLTSIQRYADNESASTNQILAGIRRYSSDYFLPEIKDELAGYADPNDIQSLFEGLAAIGKKEFDAKELLSVMREQSPEQQTSDLSLLRILFECSAVGIVRQRDDAEPAYVFRYRSREAAVLPSSRLVAHPALWIALDLMRGLSSR